MSKIALSRRLAALVSALAVAGAVLVACGSGDTGSPSATSTSTSASSAASDMWFTSVKSCDLLDQSQLAALGFTGTGSVIENDSTLNSCQWDQSQYASLGIALASSTYDSLPPVVDGGSVTDTTVAGRPGKITQDSGTCDLAVKATNGSRAQVVVTALSGSDKACTLAKQAAQDIAPKLPALSS